MGRKKARNNKPSKGKDKQHVSPTTSGKKARGSSNDLGHVSPSTRRTGGAPQQIPVSCGPTLSATIGTKCTGSMSTNLRPGIGAYSIL